MEKLRDAKVFYVNIGSIPPENVQQYLEEYKKYLSKEFDISGVVFVPSRLVESGWQVT